MRKEIHTRLLLASLCVATAHPALSYAAGLPGASADQAAAGPGAPDPSANGASAIEEIIVTARKREENLQNIPVAVTSNSGQKLEQQGIRQTSDLQRVVPSLTVATGAAAASQTTSVLFSLRGQAAGDPLLTSSQPVGVYEDTVNIPHPDGLQGAFFDIARVEVLKGPQGTLYGRNTTGGAVNILTRGADFDGLHGFVSGEVGNHDNLKYGGAINLPLVEDKLAARIAYQHWDRDGYGQSVVTKQKMGGDHDDDIVRLSLLFRPAENFTSTTKFEYAHLRQAGRFTKLVSLPAGSSAPLEAGLETGCGSFADIPALATCGLAALAPYLNDSDPYRNGVGEHLQADVKTYHAVEDISWSLNDDVELRSVTGFHKVVDFQNQDLDATPFQILGIGAGADGGVQPIAPFPAYPYPRTPENDYHAISQEFNLSGKAFDRLTWLVGGFASWEKGHGGEPFIAFSALTGGTVNNTTSSIGETTKTWALFTQNDLRFTDRLSATVGLRYTEEHQTNRARLFTWTGGQFMCAPVTSPATAPFPAPGNNPDVCPDSVQSGNPSKEDADGVSYLASLNYQVAPQTLVYVKTAKGFRGGALQFRAPQFDPVSPETATDYEIGFKSDFFDRHLRTNFAAYQTNYSNKQEYVIVTINGAPTTQLVNAATARIRGVEGEVIAEPGHGFSLFGNFTYIKGKYKKFTEAVTPEEVPFDASGLSFADPNWSYSVGGRYQHDVGPGALGLQLDWAWRDKANLNALNIDTQFPLALTRSLYPSIGLLNARIDYDLPQAGVTIALFATNVLDKHYQLLSLFNGGLGIGTAQTLEPRMVGISLTKKFGSE